jgi:hypothetical protein
MFIGLYSYRPRITGAVLNSILQKTDNPDNTLNKIKQVVANNCRQSVVRTVFAFVLFH